MKQKLQAFTLVETLIAMSLIGIIFLLVMQSLSSMLLGSYLVDARTAVRTEGEFIDEYFKLRVKNADPKSLVCSGANSDNYEESKYVTWQNRGTADTFTFYYDPERSRFCMDNNNQESIGSCQTVLTYNDVQVKDVAITCQTVTDEATGQSFTSVNLSFLMDSTQRYGDFPAVSDVSRFITVSIR